MSMPFKLFPFSDGAKQLHTVHIMRLHSVSHQGLARLEEAEAEAEEDGEVTIFAIKHWDLNVQLRVARNIPKLDCHIDNVNSLK